MDSAFAVVKLVKIIDKYFPFRKYWPWYQINEGSVLKAIFEGRQASVCEKHWFLNIWHSAVFMILFDSSEDGKQYWKKNSFNPLIFLLSFSCDIINGKLKLLR